MPAFIATSVATQELLLLSRYEVGGHAGGHLSSATAPFMSAAVIAILLWATPRARRQADVLAALLAWFAMTVAVMFGNLRVVDDLVDAGYGNTPASEVPDIADHSLANSSIWYAVVAGLLVVAAFRWRGHIGKTATVGCVVAMIFPPWMIPGAGVVVLMIVRCVARGKQRKHGAPSGGELLTGGGAPAAARGGSTTRW